MEEYREKKKMISLIYSRNNTLQESPGHVAQESRRLRCGQQMHPIKQCQESRDPAVNVAGQLKPNNLANRGYCSAWKFPFSNQENTALSQL